jgi:hypothetical protein
MNFLYKGCKNRDKGMKIPRKLLDDGTCGHTLKGILAG